MQDIIRDEIAVACSHPISKDGVLALELTLASNLLDSVDMDWACELPAGTTLEKRAPRWDARGKTSSSAVRAAMTRDRSKVVERDGALRMSCCRAGRDARVAKESERLAAAGALTN